MMLSAATPARSEGLLLVVPFVAYLGTRLRSRQLTTSTGAFMYGRVTFADRSASKPPADERWLCLPMPASRRSQSPQYYVWASQSPIQQAQPLAYLAAALGGKEITRYFQADAGQGPPDMAPAGGIR